MSDSAPEGLRKTNPIGSAPLGTGIPPVSPDHGRDAHATLARRFWLATGLPVGESCEQSQFGAWSVAQSGVRNEPNCDLVGGSPSACVPGPLPPQGNNGGKRLRYKRSQLGGSVKFEVSSAERENQACETNPISAIGIPHHSTIPSFHHSNPTPMMRNEPNLRRGRPLGPADRAKRTQFRKESQVSGFKSEAGELGGESSCFKLHTSNLRRSADGTCCTNEANWARSVKFQACEAGETIMRNEPNSGRLAGRERTRARCPRHREERGQSMPPRQARAGSELSKGCPRHGRSPTNSAVTGNCLAQRGLALLPSGLAGIMAFCHGRRMDSLCKYWELHA